MQVNDITLTPNLDLHRAPINHQLTLKSLHQSLRKASHYCSSFCLVLQQSVYLPQRLPERIQAKRAMCGLCCQAFREEGLTFGEVWLLLRCLENFRGSPGIFLGSPGIVLKVYSQRSSWEVAGNFWGSSGNLCQIQGDPKGLGKSDPPPSNMPRLSPTNSCGRIRERIHIVSLEGEILPQEMYLFSANFVKCCDASVQTTAAYAKAPPQLSSKLQTDNR